MAAGPGSTSPALTVDSAVDSVFGPLLSDEPEYREEREIPTQAEGDEPEAPKAEAEGDPEPPEAQDEAESTEETDEAAEPETEEPTEAPKYDPTAKFKVKVDGKEEEVTLEELAKGYSRTADYTRKTQAAAEYRKVLETETSAARQERAQLAANLKLLDEAITEITPKEPDWAQIARDHPDKYAILHAEWQQGEKDRAEIRKQRDEAEKKVQADRFEAMQETVKVEREKLFDAIPEWKDDKVMTAEKDEIVKFAAKYNITAEDLKAITDHRHLVFLRDAMRFHKSQAKKPALIQQIEKVRTTKPGDGKMSRPPATALQRSLERLAKNRTQDDLKSVFINILED